jgi:hypothetical protein
MLAADPHLSAVEMRRRLLASVDRVPGLAGRVASGGRLNAARALVPPARAATPPPPSQAYALSIDVKAIALALERHGLRYVLRHGVRASRLHAFSAGRFTLVVRSRGRRVARASRACAGPAVCSMTARVSRRGRRVLRRSRHPRLALALTFAPRTGAPLVHRAAVRLGR